MIQHVVLVQSTDRATTEQIIGSFRRFEGIIPEVASVQSGVDFSGRCRPYDVLAIVTVPSRSALEAYQNHPAHQELVAFLNEAGCVRMAADIDV